jgi:hypothetical protein
VYDIADRIRSFELVSEKVAPSLQIGSEKSQPE